MFDFDHANRLRGVEGQVHAFYDGHGRRVFDSLPNTSFSGRTSFYDKIGKLISISDDRQDLTTFHFYLGSTLVSVEEHSHQGGAITVKYQHTDALGSPVAVTDSNRNIVERSEFEPYGAVVNRPLRDGVGYTGHLEDESTGLVYMQQRYYDPMIGRFISIDPVAADRFTGGNDNRYWYANNNPYTFTDPDGRCPEGAAKSSCVEARDFDSSRSGGQNIQASPATEAAMIAGSGLVAVGSGNQEKLGFTVPSEDGSERVVLAQDLEVAGSGTSGFRASGTPPEAATGVIHGHVKGSGLIDASSSIGDAGPLLTHELPNATVSFDSRRIGVTEISNGRVHFRMIKGRMTQTEIRAKQNNVNTQQRFFYRRD